MILNRIWIAWRSVQREKKENGTVYAASWFARRFYYRYLHGRLGANNVDGEDSSVPPISIFVPAAEKDINILPHCLAGADEMIRHTIKTKAVVGPESPKLRELVATAGWEFIQEDKFLPRPASELKCRGWVLQQLIKFNAAFLGSTEDYLVLDADTVFLRPQFFFKNGKTVLRYSDQYELLYNRSLELICAHTHRFPVSFVTHHMVFNRGIVKELLSLIEQRFQRKWWEGILQDIDKGHPISFSEYELYGNHVVSSPGWKKRFALEYWKGLDKYAEDFRHFPEMRANSNGKVNSISFHWHTQ
jgi:hypothetical protein